jgi:multidrug efflux pump subunit AcrA (membrane-fusion protein)
LSFQFPASGFSGRAKSEAMRARKLKWVLVLAVLVAGAARLGTPLQQLRKPQGGIPTVAVTRGRLEMRVYTTGELRASKSEMIVAPSMAGTLRIVRLAKTGEFLHAGDVAVEFDPSEQEYNREQNRLDLLEAQQEIAKAKADAAVQASKDQVELLKAQFDVRRAELDVSQNEIVSAIDAKKNLLELEEAKRHLAQLEQDIKSHTVSNQAALDVAKEKERKAQLLMQQAEHNIQSMKVKTTIEGLVSLQENRQASGGFFFPGMKPPEYREGDQVWPGTMVAEVMNTNQMEINSKVDEGDRANLNTGEPVEVKVDALPGRSFRAKVKAVAGMASRGPMWSATNTTSKFDITIGLDKSDSDFRPGLTVQAVVQGGETKDVLLVPAQALFEKDGKPILYVRVGSGFEPRPVKVAQRTESQVALEGVAEGTVVAVVNPEEQPKPGGPAGPGSQPTLVSGGGR